MSQGSCAKIRGVHVLVAPDKLAGTLTAVEAAAAIACGWSRARQDAVIDQAPLSDGGPGFVPVLHVALGGRLVPVAAHGPLGGAVAADVLVVESAQGRTAYVESAQACGLALVEPDPQTALTATTAGVADLLRAALAHDVRRVVVGVGGTASTDGGRGCFEALGGERGWPPGVELVVASDVTAPLLGPTGAAAVFGAQKGADPATVERLEQRLRRWADVAGGAPGAEGAGAGGGLGYGLTLLGARVAPGLTTVIDAVGLAGRLRSCDLVVTAEGRLDPTSLLGKVPGGVGQLAKSLRRPCYVLAGQSTLDPADLEGSGLVEVRTLVDAYGLAAALADPADRLAELAEGLASSIGEVLPSGVIGHGERVSLAAARSADVAVSPWNTRASRVVVLVRDCSRGAVTTDHDRRSRR